MRSASPVESRSTYTPYALCSFEVSPPVAVEFISKNKPPCSLSAVVAVVPESVDMISCAK